MEWTTISAVHLPSGYGVSMQILPLVTGPGLMIKQIVWTIGEIFDILVEHDRYSIGNFQVNANWDDDTVAFGSHAVTDHTLLLTNVTDTSPVIRLGLKSKTLPIKYTSEDGLTSDTRLSTAQPSLRLDANDDVQLYLTYVQDGALYHDVQIYNATLKALIQIAAGRPT